MTEEDPNKTRTVAALIEVTVPEALVKQLKKAFPANLPGLEDSERKIWSDIGFQRCLDYLETLSIRQANKKQKQTRVVDDSPSP